MEKYALTLLKRTGTLKFGTFQTFFKLSNAF